MIKIDCKMSLFSALTLNWNYKNCDKILENLEKCQVFSSFLFSWGDIRKCEPGAIVPVDFDKIKELQGFLQIPRKILKVFKLSTLALILTTLDNASLVLPWSLSVFQGYPWNDWRRLPLTLIDPWNSTSRSGNIEIHIHNFPRY